MPRFCKITPECIEFALAEMSKLSSKSTQKKLLKEKFSLSARSCERVLSRAREEFVRRAGKSIDELRMEASNFYMGIMANAEEPVLARLRAMEGYVKLYGLARPERIEVSGPDGGEIKVANKPSLDGLTPEQLAVLRAAIQKSKST